MMRASETTLPMGRRYIASAPSGGNKLLIDRVTAPIEINAETRVTERRGHHIKRGGAEAPPLPQPMASLYYFYLNGHRRRSYKHATNLVY